MKIRFTLLIVLASGMFLRAQSPLADGAHRVAGELMQWHRVQVNLGGPASSETADPNPFTDLRMEVTFTQGDLSLTVPGFFAADGDAANSGASSGNVWRAYFNPPQAGSWSYQIDMWTGPGAAPFRSGTALAAYSGLTGTFEVAASDKSASGQDFRGHGVLRYVGEHHLRFAGSGKWFFKAGPGDPENFLGYDEFDNTPTARHDYAGHPQDWEAGDPVWGDPARGKDIIGMVNYLGNTGVNTLYFLLWAGGDGKDAYPFTSPTAYRRFDVSKLDQWEIVFSHMQTRGIHLHAFLFEAEIDNTLDGGSGVGIEHLTYFREMVARFGHHNALSWNIGEEIDSNQVDGEPTDEEKVAMGDAIFDFDAYDHSIGAHPGSLGGTYSDGSMYKRFESTEWFSNVSMQTHSFDDISNAILGGRIKSAANGRKYVFSSDEQGGAGQGIDMDPASDQNMDVYRREVLWRVLVNGGGGVEYYFAGNEYNGGGLNDARTLDIDNFRLYDQAWVEAGYALSFLVDNAVPFQRMQPANDLVSDAADSGRRMWGLAEEGMIYMVVAPDGGEPAVDFSAFPGREFEVYWFDPRAGGMLETGGVKAVSGGAVRSLGLPPRDPDQDWVVLVRKAQSRKLLFVRGGDGTGGGPECGGALGTNIACKTEQLASITNFQTFSRNHGWGEMAGVLEDEGFELVEVKEGDWDAPGPFRFSEMDLSEYAAVVLGSNNVAGYPVEDIDALENYVRNGGAVLFISDANFGPTSTAAMVSDQQFLDRFGLIMNRDSGFYSSDRTEDYTAAGLVHPILEGVDSFLGEGVSPITVPENLPAGVSVEVLAVAETVSTPNDGFRAPTAQDGTLVAGTAGSGRIAGFYDRNTFFNDNGAGSNLDLLDNRTLAVQLFRWLAFGDSLQPGNTAPSVNAGDDVEIVLPVNSFQLSGTVSDSEDTPVVTWTADSVEVQFENPAAAVTRVTFPDAGTYMLTLSANDGFNIAVTDSLTVRVRSNGVPDTDLFAVVNGTISMEAENAVVGSGWVLREDPAYSNGKGVEIDPALGIGQTGSTPNAEGPERLITFTLDVQVPATFDFWYKLQSSGGNSFFWSLNGGEWTAQNGGNAGDWVQVTTGLNLSAGEHTLVLNSREGGTVIDKLVLLPAAAGAPAGDGPADTAVPGGISYESKRVKLFGAQASDPSVSDPDQDGDDDGIPNFVEYVFALNPLVADEGPVSKGGILMRVPGEIGAYAFSFIRRRGMSDVRLRVEMSTNLENWHPLPVTEGEMTVDQIDTDREKVSIDVPTPDEWIFLRVEGLRVP